MPIRKRGGGTVKLPQPKPKPKAKVKRSADKKPAVKKPADPPKPKKLLNIKKRSPMSSEYVYLDEGILVVKTPASCTKWNEEFRKRVIRDYIEPRTLKMRSEFLKHYERIGGSETVYKVQGARVQVHQPHEDLGGNPNHVVVLRTDVVNLDTGETLFLYHKDPAMRILMIYCFLTGERPGGLPKLSIAANDPE